MDSLNCPFCKTDLYEEIDEAYANTGEIESEFTVTCPGCNLEIAVSQETVPTFTIESIDGITIIIPANKTYLLNRDPLYYTDNTYNGGWEMGYVRALADIKQYNKQIRIEATG